MRLGIDVGLSLIHIFLGLLRLSCQFRYFFELDYRNHSLQPQDMGTFQSDDVPGSDPNWKNGRPPVLQTFGTVSYTHLSIFSHPILQAGWKFRYEFGQSAVLYNFFYLFLGIMFM